MFVSIYFRTKDGTQWSIPCRDEALLTDWVEQLRQRNGGFVGQSFVTAVLVTLRDDPELQHLAGVHVQKAGA